MWNSKIKAQNMFSPCLVQEISISPVICMQHLLNSYNAQCCTYQLISLTKVVYSENWILMQYMWHIGNKKWPCCQEGQPASNASVPHQNTVDRLILIQKIKLVIMSHKVSHHRGSILYTWTQIYGTLLRIFCWDNMYFGFQLAK